MPRPRPRPPLLAIASLIALDASCIAPSTARADVPADESVAAETLFVEAKALMKEGRYALACAKFRESDRLDPGIGVRLHLASCYESNGQFASAWVTYRDAGAMARRAHDARAGDAERLERAIEPHVSRLRVVVPEATRVEGLRVVRNETEVSPLLWGSDVPVDGGEYTVRATAPGRTTFQINVHVPQEGGRHVVEVPPLTAPAPAAIAPEPPPIAPVVDAPVTRPGRAGAYIAGGAALAALGAGAVFGIRTFDLKSERDGHCDNVNCDARGRELDSDARTSALVSTVAVGVGLAAAGVAVWLFVRSPPARSTSQTVRLHGGVTRRGGAWALEYEW